MATRGGRLLGCLVIEWTREGVRGALIVGAWSRSPLSAAIASGNVVAAGSLDRSVARLLRSRRAADRKQQLYSDFSSRAVQTTHHEGEGRRVRGGGTTAARLASKMSMKCWLARRKASKYSLTSSGSSTRASTRYISLSNALKTGERPA